MLLVVWIEVMLVAGPKNEHHSISIDDFDKAKHIKPSRLKIVIGCVTLIAITCMVAWIGRFGRNSVPVGAQAVNPVPDGSSQRRTEILSSTQPSSDHLPCSIERLSLSSGVALQGRNAPAILSGWEAPEASSWSRKNFLASFGGFAQYLKGPDVQPLQGSGGEKCVVTSRQMAQLMGASARAASGGRLLFFTNDVENKPFLAALAQHYSAPPQLHHVGSFQVFSAMDSGGSHAFHRHGEAWIGGTSGAKAWWVLPPEAPPPPKVNACDFLSGKTKAPAGSLTCVQRRGEVVHLPGQWWHATCAVEDWTVGVGAQVGDLAQLNQRFEPLDKHNASPPPSFTDPQALLQQAEACGVQLSAVGRAAAAGWEFFDGDLNQYYNKLHAEEKGKRNPADVETFAVHRWLGPQHSTVEQYRAVHAAIRTHHAAAASRPLRVFDAGCGLGAGLMWLEAQEPSWQLEGHTISEEQWRFVEQELPPHRFRTALKSFDEPPPALDAVYSIEAFIHSLDGPRTIAAWAAALQPGGVLAILDDFLEEGAGREEEEVALFRRSWLANTLLSLPELAALAAAAGLEQLAERDIGAEFGVVELNYQKHLPEVRVDGGQTHQGWMGAKLRQRLTVQGKLTYRLAVFRKRGGGSERAVGSGGEREGGECAAVAAAGAGGATLAVAPIPAQLMTGEGEHGGAAMKCISGWYCCGKGAARWEALEAQRTSDAAYLRLPQELFAHYLDVFVGRLNAFYRALPADFSGGRFLDIGGTGSTASGMAQVRSKFAHWAGPLEYWVLDSDPAAKGLPRALACDMASCPEAADCSFEVTFSHTVLEHSPRPWAVFDEIARLTKRGGLTLHLVPFSYQYHATPEDHFRFSHKALESLLTDRGFTVLEVGYDVCEKPADVLAQRRDEHFDVIWLSFVVARKN